MFPSLKIKATLLHQACFPRSLSSLWPICLRGCQKGLCQGHSSDTTLLGFKSQNVYLLQLIKSYHLASTFQALGTTLRAPFPLSPPLPTEIQYIRTIIPCLLAKKLKADKGSLAQSQPFPPSSVVFPQCPPLHTTFIISCLTMSTNVAPRSELKPNSVLEPSPGLTMIRLSLDLFPPIPA